jgi:hypothetical protein
MMKTDDLISIVFFFKAGQKKVWAIFIDVVLWLSN